MGRRQSKKLVAVPEPIVEELTRIAREAGLTVQELVAVVLSYAVRVLKGGDSVRGLFSEVVVLSDLNRLGAFPVPQRSIARVVEALSVEERRRLIDDVKTLVSTVAVSARLRGVFNDSPRDFVRLVLPEASVDGGTNGGDGYLIVTLRESYGEGFVELVREVVKAAVEGLGYSVLGVEVHGAGTIIVVRYQQPSRGES